MGAHMRQIQKTKGISIIEQDVPEIPYMFELVFEIFQQLHVTRTSSGFGPNPIQFQEILAWSQLFCVGLDSFIVHLIRRLDFAYMQFVSKENLDEPHRTRNSPKD